MSLCVLSIDLATNVSVTSPHHNHPHCTQRVMCSIRSPHSEGYRLNMLTILRGLILLQSEENKEDNNSRRNFMSKERLGMRLWTSHTNYSVQCLLVSEIHLWTSNCGTVTEICVIMWWKRFRKKKNMNFFFQKLHTRTFNCECAAIRQLLNTSTVRTTSCVACEAMNNTLGRRTTMSQQSTAVENFCTWIRPRTSPLF